MTRVERRWWMLSSSTRSQLGNGSRAAASACAVSLLTPERLDHPRSQLAAWCITEEIARPIGMQCADPTGKVSHSRSREFAAARLFCYRTRAEYLRRKTTPPPRPAITSAVVSRSRDGEASEISVHNKSYLIADQQASQLDRTCVVHIRKTLRCAAAHSS